MANHGCINGTLDGANYASPMPLIGLYIAGASLVCMFLIVYDILAGFLSRKRWLPCVTFKLNSVTLTLLSVVVKLPVDLTTPMPSAQDQLSKLSATTLLCTYMAFIMPSLGVDTDSTNMYALSILVITVIVNMCIQISTGVIVLFIAEHIIIFCCMLGLLMLLWLCVWETKALQEIVNDRNIDRIRFEGGSVLGLLRKCYVCGYNSNPQFALCKTPSCATIGALSLVCLVTLVQASFRSLVFKKEKFCSGNSDYGWSMLIIVITQIFTVIVGSFAPYFRRLTMFGHMKGYLWYEHSTIDPYFNDPIFATDRRRVVKIFGDRMHLVITLVHKLFLLPLLTMCKVLGLVMKNSRWLNGVFKHDYEADGTIDGFEIELAGAELRGDKWALWKSVQEMKTWVEECKIEPNHLPDLLSKYSPSQKSCGMIRRDETSFDPVSVSRATVSVVVLVRVVQVCLPPTLGTALQQSFSEAYELMCFIGDNLFPTSKLFQYARAVWTTPHFNEIILPILDRTRYNPSLSELDHALEMIQRLEWAFLRDSVGLETAYITPWTSLLAYSSMQHLYDETEHTYVNLLQLIFAQLPSAILKVLNKSPTSEDYLKTVRLVLKFLYKFESSETHIQWKFPEGLDVTGLITTQFPTTQSR